jgi:hypothetical protein
MPKLRRIPYFVELHFPKVPHKIRQSIEIQDMLHRLESDLDRVDYSEVDESILKKADK